MLMIAVARYLHRATPGIGADLLGQFRRDLLGSLAQLLGELKRRGHRHFAEIALPRLLDGDG